MIPVTDALKTAVIKSEKPKTITLYPNDSDISVLNWYKERYTPIGTAVLNKDSTIKGVDLSSFLDSDKINTYGLSLCNAVYFSFDMKMSLVSGSAISFDLVTIGLSVLSGDSPTTYLKSQTYEDYDDWRRVYVQVYHPERIKEFRTLSITFEGSSQFLANIEYRRPQVDMLPAATGIQPYNDILFATDENVKQYVATQFNPLGNSNVIQESFAYTETICSAETLKFGGGETSKIELTVFDTNDKFVDAPINISLDINSKGTFDWKEYTVKEVEKTSYGDKIAKKLKAYDKAYRLGEKAYSWYTQYMWGMNGERSTQYAIYNFDYQREIFSTYFNLAKNFGVDGEENLTIEQIDAYTPVGKDTNDFYVQYDTSWRMKYSKREITLDSNYTAYMVDYEVKNEIPNYREKYDSLLRGASNIGSICVEFYDSQGDRIFEGGYLYDCRDIILPPEHTAKMVVYCPSWASQSPYTTNYTYINDAIYVYGVNFELYNPYDIVNATQPLPYYSYIFRKPTKENICKADSSITARDVMRSLMEMCGCFFRIDREGHPQFLYASQHGLYPANTLLPANDLFPQKSSEMTMPTTYYITAEFAEEKISNYGGVQVVVNTKDNTGTVCRWEYWGDDSSDTAYMIDDNIFLCANEFIYEQQNTGNIDTLLENLWNVLYNMSYTPYSAETIGTPFLEAGDRFTLLTRTDGFESFIFERKLRGIQALRDHYEARGTGNLKRIKTFEWEA